MKLLFWRKCKHLTQNHQPVGNVVKKRCLDCGSQLPTQIKVVAQ